MRTIIKVLSHAVEVIEDDPKQWAAGGMGRADSMKMVIRLNAAMPVDAKVSTVLHEVIHLGSDMLGLDLSEAQVNGAAAVVFSLLRDNEEYMLDLIDQNKVTETEK